VVAADHHIIIMLDQAVAELVVAAGAAVLA
jgi:hypothetical protein